MNLEGSFECECHVGYEGDDDGGCRDKNECQNDEVVYQQLLSSS